MNPQVDLSGLKDLHMPTPPAAWPLPYGWWALGIGLVAVIILFFILKHWWHQRPVIYALHQYRETTKLADDRAYLKAVSQLLRRVAIALYGRSVIASLSDQKWEDFLLSATPDTLTQKQAHLISFAPYQTNKKITISRPDFDKAVPLWIKKVFKNKKSS